MITKTRVTREALNGRTFFFAEYKDASGWHKASYRAFTDKKDALRVAKSALESQGFSGLTTGGSKDLGV